MATASWMLRHRNVRSGRFSRNRHNNQEDDIKLDITNDSRQNIADILSAICQQQSAVDLSDGKRLNYLNAFVKVTLHIDGKFEQIGFTIRDILCCLRLSLIHESTQIRAGGLRAIRHVLRTEDDIVQLNKLLIPFLIARSLDLVLKNDMERIEAMKLIRKVLLISPSNFNVSLARSLVALANGGAEEKDRMLRICLATLSELGVVNTKLFIESGGVAAITRNLLECQTPKIAESLCGVLLLLLDRPGTRDCAAVDLHSIAAPYCDFHYRHGWKEKDKRDERELRFNCSRLALLSILRSWPGILHFCSPNNKIGLKAIVEILYLNQLEVRKAVLDLLYELLGLPQPEWTDELSVALSAVDPCEPHSSWRLNEGFVAAEGRSILPHLAKTTPSVNDMHLALLLYCFLECGLLGAIVEVIATSDTFISVRATVLLGELLHLIQIYLPPECCNISPSLPSLLEYATIGKPQAVKAVTGLQQLHKLLRKRPASYSLHLDFILRSGNNMKFTTNRNKKVKRKLKNFRSKLHQLVNKEDDIMKETGVLLNKDAFTWNWNVIRIILKGEIDFVINLNDTTHKTFMKRLVDFYTPSKNRYSHMDLNLSKISLAYTMSGIELITSLIELDCVESGDLLMELFRDILDNIVAITTGKSVHDCLFSPQHMISTQCQSYFLFIGQLATTDIGIQLLDNLDMFKKLQDLATTTNNDCYVKLIISSLDYSKPGPCRSLLAAVLKCNVESSRLYATQFLLVLMRAGINNFSDWGVKLLVNQLDDKSRSIYLTALTTLHEACEIVDCLEMLIKLNPNLMHLNEKGTLLTIRYLSIISGYQLMNKNDFIIDVIKRWTTYMNYRYIKLVEGETSDALTLHQRDDDGKYDKRTSSVRLNSRKDFFLPPHLYGQLALHADGFQMLIDYGNIEVMLNCLENGLCESDQDILHLKASLWAIGHLGSSTKGVQLLYGHGILTTIINLAQNCLVYSIRATAYYVLGLIATTHLGADKLFQLGWFCTRHNRHVTWPIIEEELWNIENDTINNYLPQPTTKSVYSIFDFEIPDVESSTDDDTSADSHLTFPDPTSLIHQKSSTLPMNQNLIPGYHKRSLSESKTFDLTKSSSDYHHHHHHNKLKERTHIGGGGGGFKLNIELPPRYRNNSTTESTTSGVSSSDSITAGKSTIYEHQQILSPIPSSSSLSTLKQPGPKIRRHSESSRRISVQSASNSDKSSPSLASSSIPSKLSRQDLIGYATLRSIRRLPRNKDDSSVEPANCSYNKNMPVLLIDDLALKNESLVSLASVNVKFSVNNRNSSSGGVVLSEERSYMGISLPQILSDLFPDDKTTILLGGQCNTNNTSKEINTNSESAVVTTDSSTEHSSVDLTKFKSMNIFWQHDFSMCFSCSQNGYNQESHQQDETLSFPNSKDSAESNVKVEVLNLLHRLSNPVWNRQVKQALFQCKQRYPQIFKSVCLYSEACKLIADSTYRLIPRRMLHELFYEVNYEQFYLEVQSILSSNNATTSSGNNDLIVSTNSEFNDYCVDDDSKRRLSLAATATSPTGSDDKSDGGHSNIKSLDSLKLAYKENKFPIRKRNESKIV